MTVTVPREFSASGVAAGLRRSGRRDVALVVNHGPRAASAGVFTRNRVKAAPVRWSQRVLDRGPVRAVVLNSAGANACTGPAGLRDAEATAVHAAKALRDSAVALDVDADDVAICSTGLIGVPLDMPRLLAGVAAAAGSLDRAGGPAAAEAIMTTDRVAKNASIRRDGWSIGAMAKGAGMLAPALATMLTVVTTDAWVEPADLAGALRRACRTTFDRIDADGCMSTNDSVIVMANGASGRRPEPAEFTEALTAVCASLAGQLIVDSEGATKQVGITVSGAASEDDAVAAGRAVARSSLVKTALFGNDPNWGRILAAVGTTDAAFDPDQIDVRINGVLVCRAGAAAEAAPVDLRGRDVTIDIDLRAGAARATVLTTDLTHAYVHENSAYSS